MYYWMWLDKPEWSFIYLFFVNDAQMNVKKTQINQKKKLNNTKNNIWNLVYIFFTFFLY